MFSFALPRKLTAAFKINQLREEVISRAEIRELMAKVGLLVSGTIQEEGKVFKMHSSDLERFKAFVQGVIGLYDVFYEIVSDQDEGPTVSIPSGAKELPAVVIQLHSNAFQPRNIFINFLNQIIKMLRYHIYFEIIDEGVIIFIQDRQSFDFLNHGLNPSFIDMISKSGQLLRGPTRREYAISCFRQLGISLISASKSS